jgi:hypothetical protein
MIISFFKEKKTCSSLSPPLLLFPSASSILFPDVIANHFTPSVMSPSSLLPHHQNHALPSPGNTWQRSTFF